MEEQIQQPIQEKIESKPPIKTNWKFVVIVVVLAFLTGGVAIWFTQSSKLTPAPTQTISIPKTPTPQAQIDTSSWQTYRNDEFGFEVRYPLKVWQQIV